MIRRQLIRLGSPIYTRSQRLLSDVGVAAAVEVQELEAPLKDLIGRRHDYLRISLTERCNLRCQYCMPAEGVPLCPTKQLLTSEEVVELARHFAALGVTKVRLTGGEPTLRKDLPQLVESLKSISGIRTVAMTTNGLVLTRKLPALHRAGLDALNISLDTLRPERYEKMSRRQGLSRVLSAIDLALQLDYRPLKINTVLMRGFNDDEINDFVEFTRDREVEVRFIEFMPFSGNKWDDSRLIPYREALRHVTALHPDLQPALPRPNDTARVWQVPGYSGSVGFISSMTQHFCSSCNRLRLTADGNLKVCLFGAAEVSLRDALRGGASPARLTDLIRQALNNKKPQHAESGPNEESSYDIDWRLALASKTSLQKSTVSATTSVRRAYNVRATSVRRVYPAQRAFARAYSTLTHVDGDGRARMVDVGDKAVTVRRAEAACALHVAPATLQLLRDNNLLKGDALTVAQVAGALAAKRTPDLIPLCHALPLDHVHIRVVLPPEGSKESAVRVECSVRATARTGAEMEALTGAAVAALALYDMCKSADKEMRITDLKVLSKTGGKSDYPPPPPLPKLSAVPKHPIDPKEQFAPVNFMYY